MPKYLDSQGIAYLWSKLKNIKSDNTLTFESRTVEEWNAERDLISQENVLYIYSNYRTAQDDHGNDVYLPGLKLGDGKAFLIDLPFLNSGAMDQDILDHINNNVIHVSLADREFWNNKLNLVQPETETLILNRY